jgi:hypothetical protein
VSTDTTQAIWITYQETTVRQLRALVKSLDEANALDYAQVKIMAVDDESALVLPNGQVLAVDNLPAQGILIVLDTE